MADFVTEILQKIERGELSAREGLRLINDLEASEAEATPAEKVDPVRVEVIDERPSSSQQDEAEKDRLSEEALERELNGWKRWWTIPFWIGVIITLVSAGLMDWGFQVARFGWGFWLSWLPFLLGTAILSIAWRSQSARWLHVRVRQKPGEKPGLIAISMPLPLKFTAWLLRTFGGRIPALRGKDLDLILDTLDQSLSSQSPFYVHVNDDGEDVQVFIG